MRTPIVKYLWAALVALGLCISSAPYSSAANPPSPVLGDGLVRVKSAYSFAETIMRIKEDVAAKGIVFFQEIDQAKLASDAKITLNPSTLLVFGNPALGTQFLTSNPYAGIDWPVRLLVTENARGEVWIWPWVMRKRARLTAMRSSQNAAPCSRAMSFAVRKQSSSRLPGQAARQSRQIPDSIFLH
jgi:uncharacterized protein (DUF302 family)